MKLTKRQAVKIASDSSLQWFTADPNQVQHPVSSQLILDNLEIGLTNGDYFFKTETGYTYKASGSYYKTGAAKMGITLTLVDQATGNEFTHQIEDTNLLFVPDVDAPEDCEGNKFAEAAARQRQAIEGWLNSQGERGFDLFDTWVELKSWTLQ